MIRGRCPSAALGNCMPGSSKRHGTRTSASVESFRNGLSLAKVPSCPGLISFLNKLLEVPFDFWVRVPEYLGQGGFEASSCASYL